MATDGRFRRLRSVLSGHRQAIPLASIRELRFAARRTAVVRIVLGAALVACFVAAFTAAKRLESTDAPFLPENSRGVIVLDLSLSVSSRLFATIRDTLDDASTERRVGLVLFSDTAYEALPPGTNARELRPFLRFFIPPRRGPGGLSRQIENTPWSLQFRRGTRISRGLRLARTMLRREQMRGSVVLISDLADAPGDVPQLARTLVRYVREGIPLRIVALSASDGNRRFFERILEGKAKVLEAESVAPRRDNRVTGAVTSPRALMLAGLLLLLLLAVNEAFCGRLNWSAPRQQESPA